MQNFSTGRGRTGTRVLAAAAALLAAGAASAQDAKIGYVDVGKLLEDSPQAVAARQKLRNEFAPRNEQLEAQHKEITKLEEQFATDGDVMSAARREELERDIQRRRRDFVRERDEVREDLGIRRNEELGKLQEQINEEVAKIARDEGFDLVLTQAVTLYASQRIDITDRVLESMDNP